MKAAATTSCSARDGRNSEAALQHTLLARRRPQQYPMADRSRGHCLAIRHGRAHPVLTHGPANSSQSPDAVVADDCCWAPKRTLPVAECPRLGEERTPSFLSTRPSRLEPNRRASHCPQDATRTIAELDEAIACTQALIAEQQARIDRLDAEGGDSSRQREFLRTFEALLAVQGARRQRFLDRHRRARPRSPRPAAPRFSS